MLFIFNGTRSCKFFEFRCRLEIFRLNIGPSMWIRRDHATEPIRHERKKGKRNETNFRWPVFAERKRAIPPFATKARSFRFYCYFTRVSFPLIVSFITVEETRFVHRSRNEARNLLVIATTTRIYFDIGREGV